MESTIKAPTEKASTVKPKNAETGGTKVTMAPESRFLIGLANIGYIFEYAVDFKKLIHNYGFLSKSGIKTIMVMPDKSAFYACDNAGAMFKFNQPSRKQETLSIGKIGIFTLTNDGKYLITSCPGLTDKLKKWSTTTKELLYEFNEKLDLEITKIVCTPDNRKLLIGHIDGFLTVYD